MTTLSPPISPQPRYEGADRPDRPRAVSSMSQASTSSRRSRNSYKLDLTESSKDKRRLNTKADPSKAITEAQPSAVALEDSNLEDLRRMQHKDMEGNVITDPDRSNPTRNRMERPLDTIRAFNAAAEGTSRSRTSSYTRPMSQYGSEVGQNRRSSYYNNQGYSPSPQRPRAAYGNGYGNGYYRNSSYGFPPESVEEIPGEGQYQAPPRPMRNPNNPFYNQTNYGNGYYSNNNNVDSPMSVHSHQQSYETMTSGSDENGKSTQPSSLNSSFDHLHQTRKPESHVPYENQYSNDLQFAPVSPQLPYTNYGSANGNGNQSYGSTQVRDYDPYGGPSYSNGNGYGAPVPPVKDYTPAPANNPRVPIKLNGPSSYPPPVQQKRQSWIKRTFSRRQN